MILAEVLPVAEFPHDLARLGQSGQRILHLLLQRGRQLPGVQPDCVGFIRARLQILRPQGIMGTGLAGHKRTGSMKQPIVRFMAGLAARIPLALFFVARGAAAADHAGVMHLDPVVEQFRQGQLNRLRQRGGTAFHHPMHQVRRQRIRLEQLRGQLFHLLHAQVRGLAILAHRGRMHDKAQHHRRGLIPGHQQPQFLRQARLGIKNQPVRPHIVKRDFFQKAQTPARGELVGQKFARGRFAFMQQFQHRLGGLAALFHFAQDVRIMPAGRFVVDIAFGPVSFVAGYCFRLARLIPARAPLPLNAHDRLALGIPPAKLAKPAGHKFQELIWQPHVAILPTRRRFRPVYQNHPIPLGRPFIVQRAEPGELPIALPHGLGKHVERAPAGRRHGHGIGHQLAHINARAQFGQGIRLQLGRQGNQQAFLALNHRLRLAGT